MRGLGFELGWVVLACGLALGQDAAPLAPAKPLRVSGVAMAQQLKRQVAPVYPAEAKDKGLEGAVTLRAAIGVDGTVTDLTVVSGDPVLAKAAEDAVRQWRYEPYLVDGTAVPVETLVTVPFSLGPAGTDSASVAALRSPRVARIAKGGITMPRLLVHPAPDYPVGAKALGIGGVVTLRGVIAKDGSVKNISVLSGPPELQHAAIDAVSHWKYEPATLNGVITEVSTTINVNFHP